MITPFYVPKLVDMKAWIEIRSAEKGGSDWRGYKPLSAVKKICLHHTVTNPSGNWETDLETVRQIHMNSNGWGGVGYNYLVTSQIVNGHAVVVQIGDIASIRAAQANTNAAFGLTKDYGNFDMIGVSVVGMLHQKDIMPEQLRSLKLLLEEFLFAEDDRLTNLAGWNNVCLHKQVDSTACPGMLTMERVRDFNLNEQEDMAQIEELKQQLNNVTLAMKALEDGKNIEIRALTEERNQSDLRAANAAIQFDDYRKSTDEKILMLTKRIAELMSFPVPEPSLPVEPLPIEPKPVEPVPPTEVDPNTGKPANKFLERKFLIAIISPIISIVLNRFGLLDYLNDYVAYVIDVILWGVPALWIYVEGTLDKEKIKQAGQLKVAETKAAASIIVNE